VEGLGLGKHALFGELSVHAIVGDLRPD